MSYGLTFKGLHSSAFGVTLGKVQRDILPDVERQTQTVTGKGVDDFGIDTYKEKTIPITLIYEGTSYTTMRTDMEQLSGWLYSDGLFYPLIFDDEPARVYHAKVTTKVELDQTVLLGEISFSFTCNPYYPFGLDAEPVTPADIAERLLWDTATLDGIQYIQNFEADDDMQFTVGGTASVKPVIKIIGNIASGLTLTYSTFTWKYNADLVYDGIIIDCANETVTRMSDGANLFGNVDLTDDDYFELAIGQQAIGVAGVVGAYPDDLTVAVEFTPIYS